MDSNGLLSQIWQLIQDVIGPIGGLGAIIAGFSAWFGNLWAGRIIEKDKARHAKEIDQYRMQLDLSKSIISRYNERQFEAYNQLWTSLFDLKILGDALWKRANITNLKNFSKQLRSTKDMVGRMSLFIEDEHFAQLNQLLIEFSEYRLGKQRLIDLRTGDRVEDFDVKQFSQIKENETRLQKYSKLIGEIRDSFRLQINIGIRSPIEAPSESGQETDR